MKKTIKPPEHLSPEARKIFQRIVHEYEIDSAAEVILITCCEARDRREEARAAIAKDGAVFVDRFGQLKPSPWAGIERDAAGILARCWRLLGFDVEQQHGTGR